MLVTWGRVVVMRRPRPPTSRHREASNGTTIGYLGQLPGEGEKSPLTTFQAIWE